MLSLIPTVLGVPGGIELVVVFFVLFLLFGVPLALALLLGYRYVTGQTRGERVDELEAEITDLRAQLDDLTDAETTEKRAGSTAVTDTDASDGSRDAPGDADDAREVTDE